MWLENLPNIFSYENIKTFLDYNKCFFYSVPRKQPVTVVQGCFLRDACAGYCFQLCGGSPAGRAAALLLRRRQHPRRLHARQPPQRLASSAGRTCKWRAVRWQTFASNTFQYGKKINWDWNLLKKSMHQWTGLVWRYTIIFDLMG